MARISWQDIAKDITGITIAGKGVTRRPLKLEVDAAKRLLIELENRRVLYNDLIIETGEQVERSVREVRKLLGYMLKEIDLNSKLFTIARDMQVACRKFLNAVQRERPWSPAYLGQAPRSSAGWDAALEAFRAQLGRCVARLAVEYHLDLEGELVSILPLEPADDQKEAPPGH